MTKSNIKQAQMNHKRKVTDKEVLELAETMLSEAMPLVFWFSGKWTKGEIYQSLRFFNIRHFVLPKLLTLFASIVQFLLAVVKNSVSVAVESVRWRDVANGTV